MIRQNLAIKQGDSITIEETVEEMTSLAGYAARMFIKTTAKTDLLEKSGTIAELVITYELLNEETKLLPVGHHLFETKIFDAEDHVFTLSIGSFIVEESLETDPT